MSHLQNAAYGMDEILLILDHAPFLSDPVDNIVLIISPDGRQLLADFVM
jgi:hypothetical protein